MTASLLEPFLSSVGQHGRIWEGWDLSLPQWFPDIGDNSREIWAAFYFAVFFVLFLSAACRPIVSNSLDQVPYEL